MPPPSPSNTTFHRHRHGFHLDLDLDHDHRHRYGSHSIPTPFVSAPSSPRLVETSLEDSDFDFSARFSDVGSAHPSGGDASAFMPPMSTADELFLNGKIRPLNCMPCSCSAASRRYGAAAEQEQQEQEKKKPQTCSSFHGGIGDAKAESSYAELQWKKVGFDSRQRKMEIPEEIGFTSAVAPAPCTCCCCCSEEEEVRLAATSASRRHIYHHHHRCEMMMMMMMMTTMMRADDELLCNLQFLDDDAGSCERSCAMHPLHGQDRNSRNAGGSMLRSHRCHGDGDGDAKSSNISMQQEHHHQFCSRFGDGNYKCRRQQQLCNRHRNSIELKLDRLQGNGALLRQRMIDGKSRESQQCERNERADDAETTTTTTRSKTQMSCEEDGYGDGDGDALLEENKKVRKAAKAKAMYGQGEKSSRPQLYAELRSLAANCSCCAADMGGAPRRRRGGAAAASHRRARSLSPLRVFHMDDLLIMAPPRPSFESSSAAQLWPEAARERWLKAKPTTAVAAAGIGQKRRTLKELLSVGGNSRVHEGTEEEVGDGGGMMRMMTMKKMMMKKKKSSSSSNEEMAMKKNHHSQSCWIQKQNHHSQSCWIQQNHHSQASLNLQKHHSQASLNQQKYHSQASLNQQNHHSQASLNHHNQTSLNQQNHHNQTSLNQQNHHSHRQQASLNPHSHASSSASAFFSGAHHQYASCHKAQTEVLKKRTFLPYKHGLLGCLGLTSKTYTSMKGLHLLQ